VILVVDPRGHLRVAEPDERPPAPDPALVEALLTFAYLAGVLVGIVVAAAVEITAQAARRVSN
jgi:hypothetical protein